MRAGTLEVERQWMRKTGTQRRLLVRKSSWTHREDAFDSIGDSFSVNLSDSSEQLALY
jgi:hypothetical protein